MRLFLTKPVRILIIALLSTILLIVVTSAVISLFYEKAVIRYMKKYMDEHLLTQISMDDIRFSVLKGFPSATVDINRVVMLSGEAFSARDFRGSFADTLLKARKVSFRFDLIKLFHKEYVLKKIQISDGFVNILIDKKGRHNLNIWKSDEKGSATNYSINLQGIVATDLRVRWIDLLHRINLLTFSHTTRFTGTYSNEILAGEAHGNFTGTNLLVRDTRWMNKAALIVQLNMTYSHDHFRIHEGMVRLNRADIHIKGDYISGKGNKVDLAFSVPKFGLDEFISLLPLQNDSLISQYRFTGSGKLTAVITGPVSDPEHLLIRSDFTLLDCSARNLKTRINLKGINVTGSVSGTNSNNFALTFRQFTAMMGKGKIRGSLDIRNLHDLLFRAKINADLDLTALREFIDMDTVEYLGGLVRANFSAQGKLSLLRTDSANHALEYFKEGTFSLQDVGIQFKNYTSSVRNITGNAILNNSIRFDNMAVTLNGNKLLLSGSIQNLTGYLLKNGVLVSDLTVTADNYSIDYLLKKDQSSGSSAKKGYVTLFPERMFMNARLHTAGFDAARFHATDLSLKVSLVGDSMYIPDFSLKFQDGSITGNALISQNKKHLVSITCNSVSQQINIQELFTAFNNFAQNFIVDKNLKGKLNSTIGFYAQWDSTLRFIPKSLEANGKLEITDGELVQFEPMMKLSKYINVDELRLIQFKTLRNDIHIQDRTVTIPEMDIHSSAFNISAAGQQNFDNVFEYRINVLLSEVLFNKARKKKKEMDEFMIEEDPKSQTTIPLIIAGTPNDFYVKFDRKRAFSLTRHNTEKTPVPKSDLPDAGNFKIEWEGTRKEPPAIKKPDEIQNKQDDFKIEWDEESKQDNNDLN
jgi:hypothetical protein